MMMTEHEAGNGSTDIDDRVPATMDEQQALVTDFLNGLLGRYGIDAQCVVVNEDDESFEIDLQGDNVALGLLIGPRGRHVAALHEVCKTMLQRRLPSSSRARLRLDVGGYRQRRREALSRYAVELAEAVRDTGVERVLEPMSASDRKIVHDAAGRVDGVGTASIGDEPRRSVVIRAAEGDGAQYAAAPASMVHEDPVDDEPVDDDPSGATPDDELVDAFDTE